MNSGGYENLFPLLVPLFVGAFIAVAVVAIILDRRRRNEFLELAQRLNLRYHRLSHGMPKEYSFLDNLSRGHSSYAKHILEGFYRDCEIRAFDFHYTTGSGKHQQHHSLSFFMLRLPRAFPELSICPENFFSKIGQALGFEDIDFESVEFSRAFTVRSRDKKFAYDICHVRMMEYLLQHPWMSFEIENEWIAMGVEKLLDVAEIPGRLDTLIEIRSLIPQYVLSQ